MALVILTGYPLSGKTALARRLREKLPEHGCAKKVDVIFDEDSNAVFKDSVAERTSRSMLKSTVQRRVGRDRIVIVDSANYLKSFRYELYCVAKECGLSFMVVRRLCPLSEVLRRNDCLEMPFDQAKLRNAIERYEEPEPRNKWDNAFPYLVDSEESMASLCAAILAGGALKPNKSTQTVPLADPLLLQKLDKVLKEVCQDLIDAQINGIEPGCEVRIRNCETPVLLPPNLSAASLASARLQFMKYVRLNALNSKESFTDLFVAFLGCGKLIA